MIKSQNSIAQRERVRSSPSSGSAGGAFPKAAIEDVEHGSAQARVCAHQPQPHFIPGCGALPQFIHGNGTEWRPSTPRRFWSHPYQRAPGCVRPASPVVPPPTPALTDCEDPGPPKTSCLQSAPSWSAGLSAVVTAGQRSGRRNRLREPQPHNERGARGVLAHAEHAPPGAGAGVLHDGPRTSRLLRRCPRKTRGRVPFPGLLPAALGGPPADTSPF